MTSLFAVFLVIVAVLLIIAVAAAVWYISTSNKLKTLVIKIEEARSGIDIALTKRYDLLKKMFDITKGYAEFEKQTVIETIKMRTNKSISECSQVNSELNEAARQLNLAVEAYPTLKADSSFKQLQITVADVEEHLSASRRAYNSNVSRFNQLTVKFPSSVVAGNLGFAPVDFFQADEEKRDDVSMSF